MKDISSQVLDMLDAMERTFRLPYAPENKYASILNAFQTNLATFTPPASFREKAMDFIVQVGVTSTQPKIFSWSQVPTDLELLTLLALILDSISYKQHGRYVLIKYGKGIWSVGWSCVSLTARGKVLDLESHEVVAYPFDKFFNLDENTWTSLDYVGNLIARAEEINVTEKKDGTAILVTNTGTDLLIHTSGDWDNVFIHNAHKIFAQQYPLFYQNVPTGYTFVFELITPENKIVVDYGSETALYLLAMRNLSTGEMASHATLKTLANDFSLPLPVVYDFSSLDAFLDLRKEQKDQVEEGWVFRIRFHQGEFMFKLKYEQYFALHRFYDDTTPKRVYNAWLENTLDDLLPNMGQQSREKALNLLAVILKDLKRYDGQLDAIVSAITAQYGTDIPFAQVGKAYQGHRLSMYIFARLRGNLICVTEHPPTYAKYVQWLEQEAANTP